jgi:hypothetical protein
VRGNASHTRVYALRVGSFDHRILISFMAIACVENAVPPTGEIHSAESEDVAPKVVRGPHDGLTRVELDATRPPPRVYERFTEERIVFAIWCKDALPASWAETFRPRAKQLRACSPRAAYANVVWRRGAQTLDSLVSAGDPALEGCIDNALHGLWLPFVPSQLQLHF